MPRRKYDILEIMGDMFGNSGNSNEKKPLPPDFHGSNSGTFDIDLYAPVLSLGQYPISAENGLPSVSQKTTPVKITAQTDVNDDSSNGDSPVTELVDHKNNGADSHNNDDCDNHQNGDVSVKKQNSANESSNGSKHLEIVLDVRSDSNFQHYAKRNPGLVNISLA